MPVAAINVVEVQTSTVNSCMDTNENSRFVPFSTLCAVLL